MFLQGHIFTIILTKAWKIPYSWNIKVTIVTSPLLVDSVQQECTDWFDYKISYTHTVHSLRIIIPMFYIFAAIFCFCLVQFVSLHP